MTFPKCVNLMMVSITIYCATGPVVHGWLASSQSEGRESEDHFPLFRPKIHLNKVIPQGILHLPAPSIFDYDTGGRGTGECHWIEFSPGFKSDSNDLNYGIEASFFYLELQDSDYVELRGYSRTASEIKVFSTNVYKNSSSSKFARVNENVCLILHGTWKRSKVGVLLSMFFDNREHKKENYCPEGMSICKCKSNSVSEDNEISLGRDSSEEDGEGEDNHRKKYNRCISTDLFCNGVSNCECDYDESQKCVRRSDDGGGNDDDDDMCAWSDLEYLLMLIMTGLLFVMIPVAFLIIMMCNRRMTAERIMSGSVPPSYYDHDMNNNVELNLNSHPPHVISTVPINLDEPPSYDNLPEEVKVPYQLY